MPIEGKQLDELLSGYLDGQLSASEAAQVESILAQDSEVRARLASLEGMRGDLRHLRDKLAAKAPGLKVDFAARVLAEAQARRSLQPSLEVPSLSRSNIERPSLANRRSSPAGRLALLGLAIAACVALVINLPYGGEVERLTGGVAQLSDKPAAEVRTANGSDPLDLNPSAELLADNGVSDSLDTEAVAGADNDVVVRRAEDAEQVRYTSQWKEEWTKQLTFAMVVDMTLSTEAVNNDYVANVFAANSIPLERPVLADKALLDLLSAARMTETPAEPNESEALIYLVHTDSVEVDKLVSVFIRDLTNVPSLRTDLAFDTPVNQLMQRIIESSGGRFAISDSFALPVAQDTSARPSPFGGIRPQGKLVASVGRGQSTPTRPGLGGVASDGKSTILLLVRLPGK